MKDEHIISLIEDAPFASLSESELTAIGSHTDHCSDCRRAFQAAQVSAVLLKEHAAAAFEPSPFFHTRVMATLRERQTANSWSWSRLWRSAGALASSMVATVAALAVLTFAIPGTQVAGTQASYSNGYSAEEVILDQTSQPEEESDGQLLTTIYGGEE
jgi:anti-sigma-K factor RskA